MTTFYKAENEDNIPTTIYKVESEGNTMATVYKIEDGEAKEVFTGNIYDCMAKIDSYTVTDPGALYEVSGVIDFYYSKDGLVYGDKS